MTIIEAIVHIFNFTSFAIAIVMFLLWVLERNAYEQIFKEHIHSIDKNLEVLKAAKDVIKGSEKLTEAYREVYNIQLRIDKSTGDKTIELQ